MKCPFCPSTDNRVIDSRLATDGQAVRRRRECDACGRRFTTYERVEEAALPMVIKRDGRRAVYDRAKVVAGVRRACQKRPVAAADIDRLADMLERELTETGVREVPSTYIGERVLDHLREMDEVAYIRFASVYRAFSDAREFLDELRHLLGEPGGEGQP